MGDVFRNRYSNYIRSGRLLLENQITPASKKQHLQNASLVVIPSIIDNFPYTVLETMAMGHIVLVSKQGGQSEIIEDGVDGFIFDHEEEGSFLRQLKKVENLPEDDRAVISARARKKVREFYNPERIYEQKMKVLSQLVNKVELKGTASFPFVRSPLIQPGVSSGSSRSGLLSVIIPCFNLGKYLDETVASVLNSDYPLKEILIVNDGSTDIQTTRIIESYKSRPGFKVIEKANEGVAIARNTGAAAATGEFIAFLDADDLVHVSYYSRAIAVFNKCENVHFAGAWVQYFGDSDLIWPTFNPEPPIILYHNSVNSSALVYRRNSFQAGGMNDPAMPFTGWEDYESVISMLSAGYQGVVIPEVHFSYRVRNNSMVRELTLEKKILLYQYIQKKHGTFYATYAAEIINLSRANGDGVHIDNPSLDYQPGSTPVYLRGLSNTMIRFIKNNAYLRPVAYRIYRLLKK